jgi:hypothetical protein
MKNQLLSACIAFICFIAFWSCQSGKTTESTTSEIVKTDTVFIDPGHPALGNQELAKLYSQAEKVDIIFYNLPISVNQEDSCITEDHSQMPTSRTFKLDGPRSHHP